MTFELCSVGIDETRSTSLQPPQAHINHQISRALDQLVSCAYGKRLYPWDIESAQMKEVLETYAVRATREGEEPPQIM